MLRLRSRHPLLGSLFGGKAQKPRHEADVLWVMLASPLLS